MALPINIKTLVYHKGYDVREPIEVRVENQQIEIISHPGPDRSVTIGGLKNYKVTNRRYRNRRIGEFLKELHLTEGRNTSFKKILNALEKNGSPKPEFETDEEHSYFISRFFVREGFYDESTGQEQVLSDKMSDKMSDKERQRLEIILNYLKENTSITSSKAAELIGKEIKTANRLLVKAANLGLFKTEGEYKNRIYLLK